MTRIVLASFFALLTAVSVPSSARSQDPGATLATVLGGSRLGIQIEDLVYRPPGGVRVAIPRVPDIWLSPEQLSITANDSINRRVCLPGSDEQCLDIIIKPAMLQRFVSALKTANVTCAAAGGSCASLTTAWFYVDSGNVSVVQGANFDKASSATALGWEVSCTVGVSGGD